MEERIQKIISSHGVASRRRAEELIKEGLVTVNGITAKLGMKADDQKDEIIVNGKPLEAKKGLAYIMLNKPVGYVTTMSDEHSRPTVQELTRDVGVRVYPVGRLDMYSEGLLLMTNDGIFANFIMHPSNEKTKIYEVTVLGNVQAALPMLNNEMTIDGYKIRAPKTEIKEQDKNSAVLRVSIHEGRNRQVRKMCAQAGLKVKKLKRTAIGKLELGNLKTGAWRALTPEEVALLTAAEE